MVVIKFVFFLRTVEELVLINAHKKQAEGPPVDQFSIKSLAARYSATVMTASRQVCPVLLTVLK